MTTLEREPDRNLDYVAGRFDSGRQAHRAKGGMGDLSRRIDQTNERIDRLFLAALVGIGSALVMAVIGGFIFLTWAILQTG